MSVDLFRLLGGRLLSVCHKRIDLTECRRKLNIATLCTYLLAIWSGAPNGTWPPTGNFLRRSTMTTATFAALQNLSCTEARQGLSELRQGIESW
jgi:hypothetical protein